MKLIKHLSFNIQHLTRLPIAYYSAWANGIQYEANFTVSIIRETNWNKVWESSFQPVKVDDFCGIRTDFHEPILNVEHEIIITPKMSFGTGHHPTTFMMMRQMREIDFPR